ncbi:YqhR family membrane protein [Bacillus subtilis]
MMTSEKDTEQNEELNEKQKPPVSMAGRVAATGFCGGVLWSFVAYIAYLFHFSEISPNMILQPFVLGEWKKHGLGTVISIILIGVISIGAAFLYFLLMKRLKTMWPGILYGLVLWLLVFFVFNPIFPEVRTVTELTSDTIITTICIYLLYGLFVGYSISFEYNELNSEKLARALGMHRE